MRRKWYREGLEFSCTQCGDCCTGTPGYVWVTRAEIESLARLRRVSIADFAQKYVRKVGSRYSLLEKPNGDCVLFEKGCTVYAARPVQCRTFPFWTENLTSEAAWNRATASCPGAGQGRLYTIDEIDRIRRGASDASAE